MSQQRRHPVGGDRLRISVGRISIQLAQRVERTSTAAAAHDTTGLGEIGRRQWQHLTAIGAARVQNVRERSAGGSERTMTLKILNQLIFKVLKAAVEQGLPLMQLG